ncbi:MAG: MBL fold metallo-hydrolase [Acidobacteria bacterium]|nr:MAG: MBL fold metallo-hydrolase [Acidobacteriota bacterium]
MNWIHYVLSTTVAALALGGGALAKAPRPLQIYFIDVEGGQATLVVGPSRESLLIDTGWPGFKGRDAERIVRAAKMAKIRQIDYVLITHYHRDHVGGVTQLAERMKIGEFVDHGPNLEDSDVTRQDYAAYEKVIAKTRHISVRAGDGIPIKGLTVRVLTAAGEHISDPLPGAGEANPYCDSEPEPPVDATENARSLGVLITYGKFRFIDLGDLTKRKELELACVDNLVGRVDLYLVTHHGFDQSNAKAIVWALHPRVAIMNNGAHKGGSPEAWQTVHDSPGLEDLWQLHYAEDAGKEHNTGEKFIANTGDKDGNYIKVVAEPDGTFTVENSENKFKKEYKALSGGR